MNNKLYVANLPFTVEDSDLKDNFGAFGTVQSAKIMTDRDTRRSKGFGFVEMSTDAEAQAAIEGLNGRSVSGRAITVNIAKPKTEVGGFGGGRPSGGGGGYGARRSSY